MNNGISQVTNAIFTDDSDNLKVTDLVTLTLSNINICSLQTMKLIPSEDEIFAQQILCIDIKFCIQMICTRVHQRNNVSSLTYNHNQIRGSFLESS